MTEAQGDMARPAFSALFAAAAIFLAARPASAGSGKNCEAGTYRNAEHECVKCAVGRYRHGFVKGSNCTICAAGSYCPRKGLDKGKLCKQDFYCPNEGMAEPWECFFGGESEQGATKCKLKPIVLVFCVIAGGTLVACCVFQYRRYRANAEAAALAAYEAEIAAKRRNLDNETTFRTNPIGGGGGGGVEMKARPSAPPMVNGQ